MIGTRARIVLAALLTAAVLTPASPDQTAGAAEAGPGAELAGIQRSLDRLVELLEVHLAHQRVDLVLKRITLMERRLEPAEQRLRDAEAELHGRESEIERMKLMLEEQRTVLEDELREGMDPAESDTREMIAEWERHIRTEESQLDAMQMRVRELEDEIAERRDDIEILDDILLELIE
jgi:hypothetical protein